MEYDKGVTNRLKRIEGQVRGITRMLDQKQDCKDVIAQLSAAKTALERTIAVIVSANLEQCVREKVLRGESSDDLVQEAVKLLVKSR